MTDLALLFPPQWSPFQPALSLPSLASWLRRDGFSVKALDANVEFYHWLYSDTAISSCRKLLLGSVISAHDKSAFSAVLDAAPHFKADIERLQTLAIFMASDEDIIKAHFIAIHSMDLYLRIISEIVQDFKISPFHFETTCDAYDSAALERMIDKPPPLLSLFVDEYLERYVCPQEPRSLGISCIGQEQLFFTLLFGRQAKKLLNVPVLIGGTIFSRIFERGALPIRWFEKYFDIIVRNEGERPAAAILRNLVSGRKLVEDVPAIVYLGDAGDLVASAPCEPLKPQELPIPDFDDMPLGRYITGTVSLPMLASRGCYWGKCEFCHHGMVYGEKYGAYEADAILTTVQNHAQRYGATHFAFNDEAIPPKIARSIGLIFPDASTSSWAFTGLIKFEKYLKEADFANLRRIGFRSLYVGLESASERVLELMRKPNKISTIVQNLTDAAKAGIWMHCFLFFGFPGESEDDARETYDFILEHENIIGSFGCCTFSLEHNAPIFRHLEDFGVQLQPSSAPSVNVYYRYRVSDGISAERAEEWAARLNEDARKGSKYFASAWIPREHLLSLLTYMLPEQLVAAGNSLRLAGGVPSTASTREVFSSVKVGGQDRAIVAINRSNQRVLRIEGGSVALFRLMYDENLPLAILRQQGPDFYDRLVGAPIV